ncbi:two-component system sensor histidine kinase NtrB [Roseibium polysiphoniae]|uniref:histidine kinase n=1 Tax=Roseibium polysiphoniae TaxID=2571221 RepID=A0ABR9CD32_9HYPH|nr:PAS domain S-box protein [Roseibium polysiphoniae]MBD8877801.1 PAS domain S-box protein [Roseibium polysiphoniae]
MDQGLDEHSERQATVSDARLASVFDTAADGIVVINERCQVLAFNKACEKLFGYTAAELIGDNVMKIMPADFAAAHDGFVQHYLDTGEKKIIGIGREVRGRHKDGTEFPVELSVGDASTSEGRQFIGILRDLRSRKSVEERLAQAQAQLVHMTRISAMDEMGAAIAHELNQPLTAILLYLQSVSRKAGASADFDPMMLSVILKAEKEAERAGEIIQRMRQLVEKKEPEREQIEVASFAKACIELVELGTNERRSLFTSSVEPGLPTLPADPVQIRQVLVNLLKNAREAISESKTKNVHLAADLKDGFVEFQVSDTGTGVPEDLVPELFKAFTGKKQKGLGLGLAISRSIAQNHGGDLLLGPSVSGRGATFILKLPVGTARRANDAGALCD